ncbi:MAG: DEAD/DEAH box helicase, partial [Planctomycetes bacterium]|nr:DEAD/DEAH box helicase [Planctomycetota bacterium]
QLVAAAQTQERMRRLWEAWGEHPGERTLVFCCSIAHANFARDWLREAGARVEAVHTGPGAIDRDQGLEELGAGTLDALCSVDLFNEGVDLPAVDRVVFLRPTESPVIFLQQLGRGLRTAPEANKTTLTVIDFVGNHRVFLERVRTLLSLSGRTPSLRDFVEKGEQPELPAGCSIEIELEAIGLLRTLLPRGDSNELVRVYRELRAGREGRPTAGELYRMDLNPRSLRKSGGWVAFLAEEGDLTPAQRAVWVLCEEWFRELETTNMTKSFKMVTLQVLLERGGLSGGIALQDLAAWSQRTLRRQPELLADLEGVKELAKVGDRSDRWAAYWNKNPVRAWCAGRWFRLEEDRLVSRFPEFTERQWAALRELTSELVDLRLAQYRRRLRQDVLGEAFEVKVISNKRDPILKLPSRNKHAGIPEGETDVRLPDGQAWRFRFVKIACNVARPVGSQRNGLPDLLRGWFGPSAGKPGTQFLVRFSPSPDGWWAEPIGSRAVELTRGEILAFPSLEAAAGHGSAPPQGEVIGERISLPGSHDPERDFAVRVSGDSMDGGAAPLRDGDWAVLRWQRQAPLEAVLEKVSLVVREDGSHVLKRVIKSGDGFALQSDNPDHAQLPAGPGDRPLAFLEGVVTPESLAPAVGAQFGLSVLEDAFGLRDVSPGRIARAGGFLFLFGDDPQLLRGPDRLELRVEDLRPGETAYVFTGAEGDADWRYAGVGRWDGQLWAFPALDLRTWRGWAGGKGVSRTASPKWIAKADRLAEQIVTRAEIVPWLEARGKRCRVVGRSSRGGIRIDGGPDGFKERTVSQADLAFLLQAQASVSGHLDEVAVNRVRYLEGTPKSSTRWIDTGWALVLAGL